MDYFGGEQYRLTNDVMSETSRQQEALLRSRLELGRLRAVGELSRRLLVDGQSIQKWCVGSGVPFQQAIGEIVAAATDGRREVVVVTDVILALAPVSYTHLMNGDTMRVW